MDKKKRFQSPPPADPITAVRESSLAFRLNTGFFLRQVGIFLVMDLLLELNRAEGMTLVVVTHNRDLAARMGRRFELKSGVLYEEGSV